MKKYTFWDLLIFATIAILLKSVIDNYRSYDSTDNGSEISGMSLHVDNKTGCEYLSAGTGGLTRRLSVSGEQLGCR